MHINDNISTTLCPTVNQSTDVVSAIIIIIQESKDNIVFLLHALKALRGLLFYMLCAVFQRTFLNIFVMILFTFSAICVFFLFVNFN